MTLHETLRSVIAQIDAGLADSFVITRMSQRTNHGDQFRITIDRGGGGHELCRRRWMYGEAGYPDYGEEGWRRWSSAFGWGIESVLAEDWMILKPSEVVP